MMMLRIRHGLAADFLRDRFGILMDAVKYAVHATQILADAYVRPRLGWGWYRGPPLFRTLTRNRPRGGYWKSQFSAIAGLDVGLSSLAARVRDRSEMRDA